MKKVIGLFGWIFLLLIAGQVNAQIWFQEGDRWVYDYSYFWGGSGYEEMWVEGDTLINGQICKVLQSQIFVVSTGPNPSNDTSLVINDPYYVYEQSDSVYWYHENEFKLIYDFSNPSDIEPFIIREGEGHPDDYDCNVEINFFTIDTMTMYISGKNRRVFKYVSLDGSTFYDNQIITVIEGIGITEDKVTYSNGNTYEGKFGYVIPGKAYGCLFDSYSWRFCSFTSNEEEYNINNDNCQELPVPVAINETMTSPNNDFDLYPNPANTFFSIQNSQNLPIKKITIFNLKGSLQKAVNQPTKEIDISNLAKGIYIVEIEFNHGLVYKKLVKQ